MVRLEFGVLSDLDVILDYKDFTAVLIFGIGSFCVWAFLF